MTRFTNKLVVLFVDCQSAERSFLLHFTLLYQFLRCSCIPTLNFTVTFYVPLLCQPLRCCFLPPTLNQFTRCHSIVSPTLNFTFAFYVTLPANPFAVFSTNVHRYFFSCTYCFLRQLSAHQRFKVFFATLHCQLNGYLTISYLDSFVCLRGSLITSSSHLNWRQRTFSGALLVRNIHN